jgi:hypothetical protein
MKMKTTRREVYQAIDGERNYQDRLILASGATLEDHYHSPEEYLLYMQDYLNEAIHTASRTWGPECAPAVLNIVRKVTALGVACMEQNGAPQRKSDLRQP